MKTRLIFSVAVVGVTAAIGTASVAVAQEGTEPAPAADPPTLIAPDEGVTGATGPADAGDTPADDSEAADGAQGSDGTADGAQAANGEKAVLPGGPTKAKIKLRSRQIKHRQVRVGKRVKVIGKMLPYVAGQRVQLTLRRNGHVLEKVQAKVRKVKHKPIGEFGFKTSKMIKSGKYKVRAYHARTGKQKAASKKIKAFRVRYPDLDPGDRGPEVKLMNKLLGKQGYYVSRGRSYSSRTARAILAFRKVNNMARTYQADRSIFKQLASGKGGYKLKYPGSGKHVEADLSRQVMVLANHGKAQAIFPISSGAPATPTIKGHFNFYRKEPGTNSHGMVNSVYFIRGYATHGYAEVPTYNASHGCLRNPIPDSLFIYNWIDLGDDIYVYN